jgi:hypothetical protein
MTYAEVFGGGTINPAQRTYLSLVTAVDVTLQWPTNTVGGDNVAADIIDVNASQPGVGITLSDARQVSNGFTSLFVNVDLLDFEVLDALGATIVTPAAGTAWFIYLTDNTTEDGTWATFQLGATVSVADAAALAGAGIKAITTSLNQSIPPTLTASTPITWVDANRALFTIWTGGVGVLDLPTPVSVGSDWFGIIRNEGTGILTVTPAGAETIDGAATLVMNPGESAFVITDNSDWFTVGLGSSSTIGFDYVSIDVSGSGDFILSGVQLDRISYNFTGLLTGNRKIIVPNTIQQYWMDNSTTGAFNFEVATAAQVTPIQVTQNNRTILYCDGTDVIDAETGTFTPPISIGQGGTGATNADDAMDNLGVGRDVLTPVNGGLDGGGNLGADLALLLDVDNLTVELVIDLSADTFAFYDDDAAAMRKAPLSLIGGITVEDEGVPLATLGTTLDFVGAGVVASGAGADKTITIDLVPVSGAADRLLRGDGAGGWVDAGASATLTAGAVLGMLDINLTGDLSIAAGANTILIGVAGQVAALVSSGGTIDYFRTDEAWRFEETIYLGEQGFAAPDVGGFGQIWVDNTVPNTLNFEDDDGNSYKLSGKEQNTTLIQSSATNNTTLANITGMTGFQIKANTRYKYRVVIHYEQDGGDIKVRPLVSQSPVDNGWRVVWGTDFSGTFESNMQAAFGSNATLTTMIDGQPACLITEGSFLSHATLDGTMSIQFAQNSSNGNPTTVEVESWCEVMENDNF